MSKIYQSYLSTTCPRYDRDPGIPYYEPGDFPELIYEEKTFKNNLGLEIHYYFFNYKKYHTDKIILFLPGIGPGHAAYLSEINELCKNGYRVLTLDYTGTDKSEGKGLLSLNQPTRDVDCLLNLLKLKEEIVVIGHSLGGYTTMNIMNKRSELHKAVVISGFRDIKIEMDTFIKVPLVTRIIKHHEKKFDKELGKLNNLKYLKSTTDKFLFIHSKDDQMVNFNANFMKIYNLHNPHFSFIIEDNKKHNPDYSLEAIIYMNEKIGEYRRLVEDNTLDTVEKRKEYFSNVSLEKMTELDANIFQQILTFIAQ